METCQIPMFLINRKPRIKIRRRNRDIIIVMNKYWWPWVQLRCSALNNNYDANITTLTTKDIFDKKKYYSTLIHK